MLNPIPRDLKCKDNNESLSQMLTRLSLESLRVSTIYIVLPWVSGIGNTVLRRELQAFKNPTYRQPCPLEKAPLYTPFEMCGLVTAREYSADTSSPQVHC